MRKSGLFVLGILGITLVFVTLTGCSTVKSLNRLNPVDGSYQSIKVPNKDFTSLGLVFAEYISEGDGAGSESGEVYTYYKLLQEAQKLGADAIVNVVIEGVQEAQTEKLFGMMQVRQGITKKTWFGSATAIKYSTTIEDTKEESVIVLGPDGKEIISSKASSGNTPLAPSSSSSSGDSSAGGKKWWNPLTWFKK
ncbi:MAG: hypothetical protein LBD96_00035 [Treponema sp.]|jgi:hypothetical protein|nr:hypothetical protein [Treponema sp.]